MRHNVYCFHNREREKRGVNSIALIERGEEKAGQSLTEEKNAGQKVMSDIMQQQQQKKSGKNMGRKSCRDFCFFALKIF